MTFHHPRAGEPYFIVWLLRVLHFYDYLLTNFMQGVIYPCVIFTLPMVPLKPSPHSTLTFSSISSPEPLKPKGLLPFAPYFVIL